MSCSLCSENGGHFKPKYGGHFDRFFQPDYSIFMAIAEDIGYDATGKKTATNELEWISEELTNFINHIEITEL